MATLVLTFKVKDVFTPELCERLIDRMRTPPALRSFRWAPTFEDPRIVIGIFNWDSVEAHIDFMNSPGFPTFFDKFQSACTSPITWFHTHIKPFPPSELFQADVVELAVLAKKPNVSPDQFEKATSAFFRRVQKAPGYRCHFRGTKHEDGTANVHVNFVGWDSVESYVATRSDEGLDQLRAVEGLTVDEETYTYHMKLQLY